MITCRMSIALNQYTILALGRRCWHTFALLMEGKGYLLGLMHCLYLWEKTEVISV